MKFIISVSAALCFFTSCNHKMRPEIVSQSIQKPITGLDVTSPPPFNPTNYNTAFYPTILDAAKGIAAPFLYQQGYYKLPGLTVNDTNINYNGTEYHISQLYWNPAKDPAKAFHDYTIKVNNYHKYNIASLQNVWPKSCPNALYDSVTKTFTATIDCVGYGSRLLAAVGNSTPESNAYLSLLNTLKQQHSTLSASMGYTHRRESTRVHAHEQQKTL